MPRTRSAKVPAGCAAAQACTSATVAFHGDQKRAAAFPAGAKVRCSSASEAIRRSLMRRRSAGATTARTLLPTVSHPTP
jgi:hypothetical protein